MRIFEYFSIMFDMFRARCLCLKNMGRLKIGKRCRVKKKGRIKSTHGSRIVLGDRVTINEYAYLTVVGGKMTIGDRAFFNQFVMIAARDRVTIGEKVMFGPGVKVYDHDHNYGVDGVYDGYTTSPITIGDNVWVGANVVILKGTTIGNNCVIGAGAVVKGNIPDNTLVVQDSKQKFINLIDKFHSESNNEAKLSTREDIV